MIVFACPNCSTTLKVANSLAGQVGACIACQEEVRAPLESSVELPSASQAFEEFDCEREGERERLGPEPWYYGFLDGYANGLMWLCLFAILSVNIMSFAVALSAFEKLGMHPAIVLLVAMAYLVETIASLLLLLFLVAMILLLVDAARNLRRVRQNTHRS